MAAMAGRIVVGRPGDPGWQDAAPATDDIAAEILALLPSVGSGVQGLCDVLEAKHLAGMTCDCRLVEGDDAFLLLIAPDLRRRRCMAPLRGSDRKSTRLKSVT